MISVHRFLRFLPPLIALPLATGPANVFAQTGVDDDRVSLPAGPGSIEGVGDDVQVDPNMGSMAYSIPIKLPAGFPGASPSLTLSYSSSSPSGPLGIGWSMAMPMIGRMTSRGAPSYTTADLFDVGGKELVQIGTDSGDLIYRARFEKDFVRYRWKDAGNGSKGYWLAENPDGSVSYFGAAPGSSNPVNSARREPTARDRTAEYCMVATVDPYGNTVSYEYLPVDGNVPLVSKISWLDDGTGQADVYSVEFGYERRPDLISDASRGFEELMANRLSSIRVKFNTETIREYILTYQDDRTAGGFSRLQRVQQYGIGGRTAGNLYPVVHSFDYSQALGVDCQGADCNRPYLVNMGVLEGSVNLGSSQATLVDINADGLPDVLNTEGAGAHRIFINTLTPNAQGGFAHSFAAPVDSATGNSSMQLGTGVVQVFDVNGDGRADLLDTSDGRWLENAGNGDWSPTVGNLGDVSALTGVVASARFVDIDDDKRVDLITSDAQGTTLFHNQGDRFVRNANIMDVGASFNSDFEFADMNGDGLNDPVRFQSDGSIEYRLNLGRGNWGPRWVPMQGPTIQPSERLFATLDDLNGDSIADLVIVTGSEIKYALNQNGSRFDQIVRITSADVDGNLPERTDRVTVMFADMNGNGSQDVVWFTDTGSVNYLEMFPVRPNLLTRTDNSIGSVQRITYTTAAEEAARARAANNPWQHQLSIPMQMVSRVDRFVTLTGTEEGGGLHEITTTTYRDGFYDGVEKQYRGFERVETVIAGDAFQEQIETDYVFDVGRSLAHRNGLALSTIVRSADRILKETAMTYADCTLDPSIPAPATLEGQGKKAIYFPCVTREEVIHKEGLTDSSAWKTVRTDMEYDVYGNVTMNAALGVVGVMGDELYTLTEYVTPTTRWLIGLPSRQRVMDALSNDDYAETLTYYDGANFQPLALGQATEGYVSRVSHKVAASGQPIIARRARRTPQGRDAEVFDPNGSTDNPNVHHTTYGYDATGFFLRTVDLYNVDASGQPYTIRKRVTHERRFQRPSEISQWMLVRNNAEETNPDAVRYRYDEFGRLLQQAREGDAVGTPAMEVDWQLGEPWSRVRVRNRSQQNGALDQEDLHCMDGRGRIYQTRSKIAEGSYQVSGFVTFNARGLPVEVWQPYVSNQADCEAAAPASVLKSQIKYDGIRREIETTEPGSGVYNENIIVRRRYLPLVQERYDGADTDTSGIHADTPKVTTYDGLERIIATQRTLKDGASRTAEGDQLLYDSRGQFAGYVNAAGHRHTITRDLRGRATRIENPNLGTIDITYDSNSNIVALTDGRGVDQRRTYDGLNRIAERWDAADRAGTLVTWHYDMLTEGCSITECTNVPGSFGGGEVSGQDARRHDHAEHRSLRLRLAAASSVCGTSNRYLGRPHHQGRLRSPRPSHLPRITRRYDPYICVRRRRPSYGRSRPRR